MAAADGADKSSIISALVAQMKSGSISKNDLFEQLSKLHRSGASGAGAAGQPSLDPVGGGAEEDHVLGPGPPGPAVGSNQEQENDAGVRGAAAAAANSAAEESVRRLVEQKRRERVEAAEESERRRQQQQQPQQQRSEVEPEEEQKTRWAGGRDAADSKQRDQISMDEFMSRAGGRRGGQSGTSAHRGNGGDGNQNHSSNNNNNNYNNNNNNNNNRASQQRGFSTPAANRQRSGRGRTSSSRSERREKELKEAAMQECTFKPQITELPASYGAARSYVKENFHSRVMKWKETRERSLAQRREDNALEEMDDCTFQPRLAPSSNRMRPASARGARKGRGSQKDVVERLYSTQKKSTRAAEAELTKKREEEFRRTCTFQPNVNKKRAGGGRNNRRAMTPSRYQQAQRRSNKLSRTPGYSQPRHKTRPVSNPQPTGMDECTFQPKVNNVSNKFASARLYLQNNVHDRLSTPRADPQQQAPSQESDNSSSRGGAASRRSGGGGGVMDMDSFLAETERKTGRGSSRRPASARRSREDGTVSTRKSFSNFLSRQNQRSARREKNLENLRKKSTPSHKPRICSRSRHIASTTAQGGFMQRLAKDALRKEHGKMKHKAEIARLESCTFKPNILASSRARPARSFTELSRGDSLKRETAARLMKLKAEQDELEGLTFRPKLNPSNARSRLNILNDPDSYLERIQKQEENFSIRRRKALQEQEMKEFAECTFHPQINDAPQYIKRIAKSMALARDARPTTAERTMPEWK